MKKLLILLFFISILFSGCIYKEPSLEANITPGTVINVTPDAPTVTAVAEIIAAITSTPVIIVKPETEYDRFVSWLETDMTDKHSYVVDNSKAYEDQYVCSQYTRDFLKTQPAQDLRFMLWD